MLGMEYDMTDKKTKELFEELLELNNEMTAVLIQLYTRLGLKNECEHPFVDPHVVMMCSKCGEVIDD